MSDDKTTAAAATGEPKAAAVPSPMRFGFCTPGNPPASHERCPAELNGRTCSCECHQQKQPAPVVNPDPAPPTTAARPRLGVYDDLDEADYHADPTSVSASGMKQILRSPAHFRHSLTHPQTSSTLDLGTIAHTLILGTGQDYVAIEGNRNRNDVKAAIEEAEAEGKLVLKPDQLAAAERMADAVLQHPHAARLLTGPGRSEVSHFWHDPDYDVIRRCRWDRLGDDGIGVDLKTSKTADPAALPKHIHEYRYDLSAAWYLTVAAGLGVDITAYALVFVESTEPHPVVVAELAGPYLDRGAALAAKALTTYRRCLDTDTWPGYCDDDFVTIRPPAWAETAEQITTTITVPERTHAA